MKKLLFLFINILLVSNIYSQISFCEDFESYQVGDYIAQSSSNWETWASIMAPCPSNPCADDAMVSNTQASTGINSLYLTDATGQGGPQDILLPFGIGIPYTTGDIEIKTDLYVTTSAYLNIQAEPYVGTTGVWALNMTIDATGTIVIDGGSTGIVYLTSSFPLNQWTELKLNINLTQNIWEVFIDNQSIGSFSNTTNKVSSMNLYPTVGNDFYADNVCFDYIPFTPLAYDMAAIDLNTSLNLALPAAPFTISGEIFNISSTTINSVDINYSVNGAPAVVDNLSGLNLVLFDTLNFNHSINWNPTNTGTYIIEIWASNLNGNVDLNPVNDIFTDTIHVWNNIAIRKPLIETFTSSTCGPCAPANVTAEALFAQNIGNLTSIKYQADFPGAGDPYFTQEGGNRRGYYAINSVPRMEIDGGWDQNGNNITQQVLDEHIGVVSFINLSANYSINIKTIDVDITIDPLENIQSNNLVVHAAIIEETTYNNVKTNGETQFEHVVKKMLPNDNGTSIPSLTGGQQTTLNLNYTFNGNYRLPANANTPINHAIEHSVEDFTNLMVVVWVQDIITKEVHQSTYATLNSVTPISYDCINDSCILSLDGTGAYNTLSNCEIVCATTSIQESEKTKQVIFPNPAKEKIYISNSQEIIKVKIFDISGRTIIETKYTEETPINISSLSAGVYQIKMEGNDWIKTKKFIKE